AANKARYQLAGEALGAIKDVKLLGNEEAYLQRFARPSSAVARAFVGAALFGQIPHYAMQIVAFGGVLLFCLLLLDPAGLASGQALSGILPLLGVFAFAGQRLMPELSKMYQGLTQARHNGAAVEGLYDDHMRKAGQATARPAGD